MSVCLSVCLSVSLSLSLSLSLSVAVIYVHEGSQSVTASLRDYYLGRGVAREHRGTLTLKLHVLVLVVWLGMQKTVCGVYGQGTVGV